MGDLIKHPHGSKPERDLAAMALSLTDWNAEAAAAMTDDKAGVEAAINALAVMNIPAGEVEPNGLLDGRRGPRTDKLIRALAVIGAKIAPTMAEEQMQAWMAAMVRALSDLPFAFAQKGAEDAVHTPMRFLNEVEGVVRDKAELAKRRHGTAVSRLWNLIRLIERAKEPTLPPPPQREMTQESINTMPLPLLKAGLAAGYITQEQYDIARKGGDAHEGSSK